MIRPHEEDDHFEFDGFGIEGKYRVVEKINDPAAAGKRFKEFVAK